MRACFVVFLVSPIFLSACGSASTSASNVTNYETLRTTKALPFDSEVGALTANVLSADPVESTASMTGIFSVLTSTIPDIDSVAGQMDMNANFASGTMTGDVSKMVEFDSARVGSDIDGSLSFTGTIHIGPIFHDDIAASGGGTFTATDGTTYSVSATLDGDFYRRADNQLAAEGSVIGTATAGTAVHSANGFYVVTE